MLFYTLTDYYLYIISPSQKTVFLFNRITSQSFVLKFSIFEQLKSDLKFNRLNTCTKKLVSFIKNTTKESIDNFCKEKIKNKNKKIKNLIHGVVFFVTYKCNMSCPNCILYRNLKTKSLPTLKEFPISLAYQIIDQLVEDHKSTNVPILISFSGAEPTLCSEFIINVIKYCEEKYVEYDFEYSINSNLLVLDKITIDLFKNYNLAIGTSLDGLGIANNINRIAKNNSDIFTCVDKNIKTINYSNFKSKVNQVVIMISNKNYKFIDESLIEYIINEYNIKKIYITTDATCIINDSIDNIIMKIYSMVEKGQKLGIKIHAEPFNAYDNLISYNTDTACGAFSGAGFTLLPDKTISFCSYTPERIRFSSINELKSNKNFIEIIRSKSVGQLTRCKGCSLEGSCIGGCHAAFNTMNNKLQKYRCSLYKEGTKFMIKKYLEQQEALYEV
ncbi:MULTISPECIES: radical SAM protein [Treponema]|nr:MULTISPECIES: radical SAM protein [Treponema]EMB47812.1 radical SAM additional 4Fe4S-binding domain-containing protein [Treponema denticola ASLM]EMD56048.1 radical SAM additional 4Fe4S-binding domain-containing protein [Treponema denticola US-Trep]UTC87323.1 4Fe-4S cluster-binding domain-containing protein [Treponema denticola]UTD09640.1 4Fe-4S cluster-binding domain-containing protein [Treponema sp. B152]